MIRLSALNDNSSDESEPERTQESIKQAQESEALELYNKALQYQHSEDHSKAEETYQELLLSALVTEAPTPDPDEGGLHHPGQVLKYSAYKNLAVLAENKGEYEKATDNYLEAVMLDDSDVTVWYHIGKVSIKCFNLTLARQAFEEGLRCNSKHWPCLDELCTVLYAIGDYPTCLAMVSDALEEDESYLKGLALRDKIFKEEPYLKRDYRHLRSLYLTDIEEDDATKAMEFVKEALHLREERLKLIEATKADPPPVNPVKPLTSYTWAALGDCFIVLYDHMTSPENPQSLGRVVNLDDYYKAIVTPDISMPHKASLSKVSDSLAGSSFSTEGFGVYKSAGSSDNDEKAKKAPKRKKPPSSGLENDFPPKRRSARVRTSKKKEEETNYKDLIQTFLPFSLRAIVLGDDESSQDSFGESQQSTPSQSALQEGKVLEKGQSSEYEDVISGEAETLDVLTFVKEHMTNGGLLDLMTKFGICLAAQRNKKWPPALADVFVKVYTRLRKHIMLPSEFIREEDEVYTGELAKVILVATELTLDKLLTAKSKSSSSLSPASSPRGGQAGVSPIGVGPGFSSKFLANDIEYLHCIALDKTIHGDGWLEFAIRVNWAKARYLMLQGQMEIAMLYLDRCTKLLAIEVSPLSEPMTVKLVNCKIDNNVTLEQVHKKLESLQRCQSLEEVHRLYELGHYEDVVQLLIPTLHQPQPKTKASELGMSIPERPAQLLLLQDSLIKLKDFRKCLECSEVALNEAVSQMSPCEAWSTTLSRLFQCMNTCIEELKTILDGFPQSKLTSLTLNIIKVIEASIYSSDVSMEPPLATAYPWVLLYKIIKNKEKDEDMDVDPPAKPDTPVQSTSDNAGTGDADNTSASNDSPSLPSSLQFLRTAHEQLGRRGWCCNNDGIFLLLSVDALTQQLAKPFMSSREDIVRDLEQCFLCLYGHPSKKAKLRGLQEHSSCQMPLTWQNSGVVFNYFKPSELPTFDAKTYTISTEVQNLMRRITLVVPPQELEAILFDNVQAFIDGLSDEVPKLPESLVTKERPVVGELFYLLADFYFKNKEFSKALKFYTHDICVKPNRSDSWAAMALIRKSRLESKLNACEPKSAGPIQKHAVAALKCFKRAMETDSTNSSILEEYGSLCYFLHSHASRQLKQFDQEEVSVETRSSLLQRKLEMLHLSEEIFSNALGMDDSEAWLHHYMLGKIAEKLKKPPQVYLEHYAKSARFLDDDIKYYPRKIPFYSPPEHVLEALEVYYRIHVSVLKLVLKDFRNIDKVVLEKHLQLAAKGPFFQPEQDADGAHSIVARTESTTSEISSESEKEPEKEPSAKKHPSIVHQPALKDDAKGKDDIQSTEKTKDPISVTSAMEVDAKVPEMITFDSTSIGSVSSDKKICDQDASKENKEGKTPREKESDENKNTQEESKGEIDDVTQSSSSEPLKSEKDEEQKEHAIEITGSPCKDSISTSDEKISDSKAVFETQNYQSEPVDIVMKEDEDNTTVKPQETRQIDKEQEKTLVQEGSQFDTNEVDQALSSSLLSPKVPTISNEFQEEVPLERPQLEQQTEDVEMKEEKTSTESVKIQEDLVLKNEPTPMETEDIISAKETNDVVQKNVETGEEQAKSETATDSYSMKENFSKELPEKTAVPSSAPASSMSGMDKDDVPLTIKEEKVSADVALDKPPSIDRNVDTVMTNEKACNIEKKEKPRSVAESIEIKEQPDVDMSSTCDTSVIPTPQTVVTGMIKTSALDDTSNNRQKGDVEVKTQATNLDDAASSIKSTEIPLTSSPSNGASMKSSGLSLTQIPNQSTDELSTNSCEPPLNDVQKQTQRELLDICIHGLEHCLQRFPQHHKSRYRLAFVNYVSPYSKDVQASRALLLGGNTGKAKLSRNPQQGLFNEKSKTNLFSAFWRIPEEDIDRPGSFCTHTYKSVDLMLQVLKELSEWDSLLNISNLLHRTPEAGKKYLRDNERHFLAKKACEFMVDIVSKLTEAQAPQSDPSSLSQLVLDTYECWKLGQKYDHTAKVSENLLIKSFEMYRAKVPESPVTPGETQLPVLERALRFCQQVVKPQTSSVSTAPQTPVESSLDSQNDDVIMQEQPSDVIQSPTSITADQQETSSRSKDVKGRLSTEDLLKSVDIKKRLLNLKDDISSKTANDSESVMLQPTGGVTRVVLKHPVSGAKIGNLLPLTIKIDKLNVPPTSAKTSVTSASISVTSSNPVTVAVSKEVSKSQPTSLISTLPKTSVPCTSLSTSIRIVTSKDHFTGITSISTLPKTSVPSASQVQSVRIVTASKDSITGVTGDQVPPITSASNLPMTSLPTASQAQSVRIVTSKDPVTSRSGDKVPPTTSTLVVRTSPVPTTPSTATSIDTTSTSNLVKKDFLITSTTLSGPLTTASSDTISKPITAATSVSTAPSKIPVSLGLSEVLGSRSVLAATPKLQATTAATHVLLKGPIISSTSNTALHYPRTVSTVMSNSPVMSATTNTQSNVKITTANIPEKSKPSLSTGSCIVSSNAPAATSSIIPGVAASSNAPFITIESDTTSKTQAPKTTVLELIKASIPSATTVATSNSPMANSTSVDISSVRVTSQVLPDAPVPSTSTIAVSSLVAAKSSSEEDSRVRVTSAARQVLPDVPSTSTIAVSSLVAAKCSSEEDSRARVTRAAGQVLPDVPAPSAGVSNVSVTSSTNVAPTEVQVTPAESHTAFKTPVSTAASIAGSQTLLTPDTSHTISSASTAASNLNVSVIASQQLTNTLVPTTAPTAAGVLICTSTTSDATEPTQSSSPMKSIGIFHEPASESSLGLSHSLEKSRPSSLTQEKEQSPAIADSIVSPSESSSVGTEVPSRTKTSPVIERSFPAPSKPKKELTALKMEKLESKIARLKHAAEAHSDVSSSTNIPAFLQPSKTTDMHDKNEEENKKD